MDYKRDIRGMFYHKIVVIKGPIYCYCTGVLSCLYPTLPLVAFYWTYPLLKTHRSGMAFILGTLADKVLHLLWLVIACNVKMAAFSSFPLIL